MFAEETDSHDPSFGFRSLAASPLSPPRRGAAARSDTLITTAPQKRGRREESVRLVFFLAVVSLHFSLSLQLLTSGGTACADAGGRGALLEWRRRCRRWCSTWICSQKAVAASAQGLVKVVKCWGRGHLNVKLWGTIVVTFFVCRVLRHHLSSFSLDKTKFSFPTTLQKIIILRLEYAPELCVSSAKSYSKIKHALSFFLPARGIHH